MYHVIFTLARYSRKGINQYLFERNNFLKWPQSLTFVIRQIKIFTHFYV